MKGIFLITCIGAIRRVGVRIWGIGRVVQRLTGRVMGGIVRWEGLDRRELKWRWVFVFFFVSAQCQFYDC